MQLIADLHTHTTASTHAMSTLQEMVTAERALGMRAMAVTDHAPKMPDAPHEWYFHTVSQLPNWLDNDFLLLRGAEVNCLGADAALDLAPEMLARLDWVVVSVHDACCPKMSYDEVTEMWLRVAANPLVDMLGHSEQQRDLYNYDRVAKACAETGTVIELNANSVRVRPGSGDNMRRLAESCMKNGARVAVNSDAHSVYGLGNQGPLLTMLEEMRFPEELVINADFERLLDELALHGKDKRATRPAAR